MDYHVEPVETSIEKIIAQRFLNFAFLLLPFNFPVPFPSYPPSSPPPPQPSYLPLTTDPHSTRLQRPIIFCPFSISLIAINPHQTLITIDRPITYVPIGLFTSVENVRQIGPFMQNKAKCQNRQNKLKYLFEKEL